MRQLTFQNFFGVKQESPPQHQFQEKKILIKDLQRLEQDTQEEGIDQKEYGWEKNCERRVMRFGSKKNKSNEERQKGKEEKNEKMQELSY